MCRCKKFQLFALASMEFSINSGIIVLIFYEMNVEEIRDYCLQKPGVTEGFPFDQVTLVFKVMNKMFCLLGLDNNRLSLKNDPEKNVELRAQFRAVIPGYHLNKEHWNTINLDATVAPKLMRELIDESYNIIVKSLPKSKKEELKNL